MKDFWCGVVCCGAVHKNALEWKITLLTVPQVSKYKFQANTDLLHPTNSGTLKLVQPSSEMTEPSDELDVYLAHYKVDIDALLESAINLSALTD